MAAMVNAFVEEAEIIDEAITLMNKNSFIKATASFYIVRHLFHNPPDNKPAKVCSQAGAAPT